MSVLILVLLLVSFISVMLHVGYLISLIHLCFIMFFITVCTYSCIDILIFSAAQLQECLINLLTYRCSSLMPSLSKFNGRTWSCRHGSSPSWVVLIASTDI